LVEAEIEQVRSRLAANEAERKELEAALRDLVSRCSVAATNCSSPAIADAPGVIASPTAQKIELVCLVRYETALIDLINQKRAGKPVTPEEGPAASNVVDLMKALRQSVGREAVPAKVGRPARKAKAAAGQKEMLMPISGKKQTKEVASKKPAARRKSA
jgi:hypothetical protein